MPKVLITPRSYGMYNEDIDRLWEQAGFETVREIGPLPDDRMRELLSDADALIIGTDKLSEAAIDAASKLKVIAKYGVGIDNIPVGYAESKGIKVFNTPGVNTESVADYTLALILAVARKIPQNHANLVAGRWSKTTGMEVYRKTIGILGFGAIGRAVARRAKGFDMNILAYDPYVSEAVFDELGADKVTFDELIRQSDIVSVHMPLTAETKHLLNENVFRRMKREAIVVNTSRGGVVSEQDLYTALKEGLIRGAGLDVFSEEPVKHSPLFELGNVVLTPHNAAATIEAAQRMTTESTQNILSFFSSKGDKP
ncbi:2-hydroxyacid dehydrogenase [Paenibacillus cisolokensis]|jgi:Phosphoglycerate dehydrogenase and related dehydrogenases|uniref:2-hydroxyacid dehydrogenase n=1 Tax=Paenibacillus cisolokensis TaxID=1658519 RepID=A0ABQ4N1N2_9BACL|nr:phosphoglycerate dehydrogenase [Paenibacillus cisolokensis]GIQ62082.1 2-hydroxyacid dehydrogenase [Paenibacillus cisolokensis]